MITAGSILTAVMEAVNETDRNVYGPKNLLAVARAYKMDVVNEHWWTETLRDFTPADSIVASSLQPVVLPADFNRMKSVRDASFTYYEDTSRGKHPIHPYNWYMSEPVKTPLQEGGGAVAENGSSIIDLSAAGVNVHASAAGEWIHIGQSDDVYQISTRDSDTQVTLTRSFRTKESIRGARWQIRPVGCKRISFCDASSTAVSPTTLTCVYQCSPLSVISEEDILELPDQAANAVLFKAIQYAMRRKGWNNVADKLGGDYIHALAVAKRACPSSKDAITPKRMFRRPSPTDILANIRED